MPVSLLPATFIELNFWEIFKFKWICCEIFISGYNNIIFVYHGKIIFTKHAKLRHSSHSNTNLKN